MTNLIANPPKTTTDLDLILQELSAQAGVIRALFSIEKCLEGDIPHHLKYERLRPILKFIHAEPSNNDARENERRETLAKLDDNSRALCGIALTLNKIKALSDSTIDALRIGLPHFITKRGLSELIETKLGSFVRRTTEEFANPTIRFVCMDRAVPTVTIVFADKEKMRCRRNVKKSMILEQSAPPGLLTKGEGPQSMAHTPGRIIFKQAPTLPMFWQAWIHLRKMISSRWSYPRRPPLLSPRTSNQTVSTKPLIFLTHRIMQTLIPHATTTTTIYPQ
jgi:hypothetical protein